MRKTITIVLMTALFAALVLTGCGKKAVFGVTTDEDNTIRVTADEDKITFEIEKGETSKALDASLEMNVTAEV